jgi:hypothetical protein
MLWKPSAQSSTAAVDARWPSRTLAMWMGLNALDALLTLHLPGLGGAEGNPLLATIQNHAGGEFMLLAKLLLAFGAGYLIWKIGRFALLGVANKLMALVVLYNLGLAAYVQTAAWPTPFAS